jgi:hypothetical protein
MPWTFAHPAAILPIRRLCPAPLDFSALVIGSMIPDLGYYLFYSKLARSAHSFSGSVLVCLPVGLILWEIFHLLRKPLCFVLPQPHRGALAGFAATPLSLRPRTLITAGVSVLLGAWTHIVWDSFTHNTWVVKQLPLLRESVFQVSTVEFPLYLILQHLSTLAGAAVLIAAYRSWLRLQRGSATESSTAGTNDRWRYLLLTGIAALALVIALPPAIQIAPRFEGYPALQVLTFRIVVYTTATFFPLLTASSLVAYATRRGGPAVR